MCKHVHAALAMACRSATWASGIQSLSAIVLRMKRAFTRSVGPVPPKNLGRNSFGAPLKKSTHFCTLARSTSKSKGCGVSVYSA